MSSNKKNIILITGSAGYIGSSVIKRLRRRFSFRGFDIRINRQDDILNLKRLEKAVRGVDGVMHLAAVARPKWGYEDPYRCLTTNIVGTLNVLEAIRRINPNGWVILGSSREVFGNLKNLPGREISTKKPLNAYGVSKLCGEELLRQYAANYGIRCLTIRFCGVYTGLGDILDRVIPKFIGQALRNQPITLEGRGKHRGDFVYIEDVVRALEKAITYISPRPRGFYEDINLVSNNPVPLRELALSIIRLTGSRSKIVYRAPRSYDQKEFWGSCAKAKRLLGWTPKVSLGEGLKKSIQELRPLA